MNMRTHTHIEGDEMNQREEKFREKSRKKSANKDLCFAGVPFLLFFPCFSSDIWLLNPGVHRDTEPHETHWTSFEGGGIG